MSYDQCDTPQRNAHTEVWCWQVTSGDEMDIERDMFEGEDIFANMEAYVAPAQPAISDAEQRRVVPSTTNDFEDLFASDESDGEGPKLTQGAQSRMQAEAMEKIIVFMVRT